MNLEKLDYKKISLASTATVIIGTFLPFVKSNNPYLPISVKYIQGDGILLVILMAVVAFLVLKEKMQTALIPTGIGLLLVAYDLSKMTQLMPIGIGGIIIVLALLVLAFACGKDHILPLLNKKK